MDEREAERQLGAAALEQRTPLEASPAEPRRGIGEVDRQRDDPRLAFVLQRP